MSQSSGARQRRASLVLTIPRMQPDKAPAPFHSAHAGQAGQCGIAHIRTETFGGKRRTQTGRSDLLTSVRRSTPNKSTPSHKSAGDDNGRPSLLAVVRDRHRKIRPTSLPSIHSVGCAPGPTTGWHHACLKSSISEGLGCLALEVMRARMESSSPVKV